MITGKIKNFIGNKFLDEFDIVEKPMDWEKHYIARCDRCGSVLKDEKWYTSKAFQYFVVDKRYDKNFRDFVLCKKCKNELEN